MKGYRKMVGYSLLFVASIGVTALICYSTNFRGIRDKESYKEMQNQSIELDKNITQLEKELKEIEKNN